MSAPREARNAEPPRAGVVLVCFAVRDECKHFHPDASLACQKIVTGIGGENARQGLLRALASTSPRLVLTCGYAGGLNPRLQPGDILYETDPHADLSARLVNSGARPGVFHCADRIAVTVADKRRLREQTNADAVEMESGIIRQVCRERGIPAATLRVISDDAATALPLDFNQLAKADGNISYARLALALLGSPGKVPRLMRFQRELDACSRRLGTTLEAVIRG